MLKINFKKSLKQLIFTLTSTLVLSAPGFSVENTSATTFGPNHEPTLNEQDNSNFTDAELAQMLAPIALYPDALLTHILIATTYPIEVVDAERWLSKNSHLSAQVLADAADDKDWDASVKALLPFPNILKKLSDDLYWMRNLGDAFLQDEAQVLASVQLLRQQADRAGNLENMDNVKVVRETKTIIIESKQPDIIYVPYYDSRVVYGDWRWSHYPPVIWYPRAHYASHHGPYYWHNPVHLTVGLFFGAVHWNNHHVVVHHHKSRYYKRHSNKKTSTSYQAKRWQHNPRHRKGVAYRTSNVQEKYLSHTPSAQQRKHSHASDKHLLKNNKHVNQHTGRQYNSSKSQNLKHKLQVNRAVKIDKHKAEKHELTKHNGYKNSHRTQTNAKTYNINERTTQSASAQKLNKHNLNKHDALKKHQKDLHNRQNNKEFTRRKNTEKSYSKPVNTAKNVDQQRHSPKRYQRDKAANKPSNTNLVNRQKGHGSRTQQSRAKQHN